MLSADALRDNVVVPQCDEIHARLSSTLGPTPTYDKKTFELGMLLS